jgi:hypothetical protein
MDERKKLIAEYESLRKLAHELDVQANTVELRLVALENLLPDDYICPDDPPLDRPTAE